MGPTPASRDDLTSRVLPQMILSDEHNPLTRPHAPLPSELTVAEKAAARFSVKGNAIGGYNRVKCTDLQIK
jgi:sorbose reductase